jgi:hypothetical protein
MRLACGLALAPENKNRQFLAKLVRTRYIVFQKYRQASWRFPVCGARAGLGVRTGNGSEMAPQTIEIAKNGLGNGEPPAEGLMTGLREVRFAATQQTALGTQPRRPKKLRERALKPLILLAGVNLCAARREA